MEYQSNLPLFYKKPVLINNEIHASTRIGKGASGFSFAASAHSIMLAGVEFQEACRFFPILFANSDNGSVIPLALLGLQSGENLFVGLAGEWLAEYVPAYLRRYPFITTTTDDGKEMVCIDEVYEGIDAEDGEALFIDGEPSPHLKGIMDFLIDFNKQMSATEMACGQIAGNGLFKPMTINVKLDDGSAFSLTDFQVIDEQKLIGLEKDAVDGLFRSGALAMIYSHLISLRCITGLLERKTRKSQS